MTKWSEPYGNMLTETSPRGVTTTYTYDPTYFGLGELTSVQEGTNLPTPKTATNYAYDHADGYVDGGGTFVPCGLVTSIASPTPGSASGSGSQVTTRFIYDVTGQGSQPMGSLGLGNVLSVTTPGNNATLVGGVDQGITTTFTYTGPRRQRFARRQPAMHGLLRLSQRHHWRESSNLLHRNDLPELSGLFRLRLENQTNWQCTVQLEWSNKAGQCVYASSP